ncbi:hypothetical protein BRARA_A02414 [Brassica rapa]|uniref:Uncharacterized protein n=1 Tax=Brassica campestris TaxID=3711 RepID=A0A398APS3_BRACM|nr:hypothetical protein BRARA_A02414 [Brassica rapa]
MQPPASATKNSLRVTNIDYMEIFINLNSSIGPKGSAERAVINWKCRKSSYGTVTGRSWEFTYVLESLAVRHGMLESLDVQPRTIFATSINLKFV